MLLYHIMFYNYPVDVCLLMRDKKDVDVERRGGGIELGGIGG